MKMTPKQRVYGGVLLACASAFVVDRLFLGPGAANAQMPWSESATDVPGTQSEAMSANQNDRESSDQVLARRLDEIAASMTWSPAETPDAFEPSAAWLPPEDPEVDAAAERAAAIAAFQSDHRLTAVMAAGERGYAMVGGSAHQVGTTLDGFTLVSVTDRSAVFEFEGEMVTLTVPD